MRRAIAAALGGLIYGPMFGIGAASAQLPQASAATLDRGFDPTAQGGGFAAIASNPAGLGRPDSPGFSMTLPSVAVQAGLGPVTWSDLADWSGELLDEPTRTDWMSRIEAEGSQAVRSGAGVTGLAITVGPFGFQASARAAAVVDFSADAIELMLYGNAGRTGVARDFDLAGSQGDGFALTTFALSYGMTATDGLYLGATAKYSIGNGLGIARNLGSFVTADPLAVDLDFPILYSPDDPYQFDQGHGVGLDIGAILEGDPVTFGVTIENLFNTFAWDLTDFSYIPGQAVFDTDVRESDFDPVLLSSASQAVRDYFGAQVEDLKPETRVAVGASWPAAPSLRVFGNVQKSLTDGMSFEPDFYGGAGAEWTGISFFHLRAHGAVITDGYQLGGGASLVLGPVHLSGGAGYRSEASNGSLLGTFTLSFGSH
jgi:hypothetical protein